MLTIEIIDSPFMWTFYVLSVIAVVYLLIRRRTTRWTLRAFIGIVAGAIVSVGLVIAVQLLNPFGSPLSSQVDLVVILTFAALGLAAVNLWQSRWWRKLIALLSIVVFLVSAALAINASFGLNKTVGAVFGVTTEKPLDVTDPIGTPTADPKSPLYQSWTAPSGMATEGRVGSVDIPNKSSGFKARQAVVYVPPAAQVAQPPALPVVIMLNGQPGTPGVGDTQNELDQLAAKNDGLAPIVVNPDQLGDPARDPLCLDTSRGKVETYIMKDVVPWVKAHFHTLQGAKYWSVVGFSNGGQCASYFGSKYPNVIGNVGDLSGDEYQGVEDKTSVLRDIFGGDQKAYEAVWPVTLMSERKYPDCFGVYTVGASDAQFVDGVKKNYLAAKAAGFTAIYSEIQGAGHDASAVTGGIKAVYEALYPRLGLSSPK